MTTETVGSIARVRKIPGFGHMTKTAEISGLFFLGCLIWLKVSGYFEGLAFTQSFLQPIILFPIILASTLGVFISCVLIVISLIRKKRTVKSLCPLIAIICLIVGAFSIPVPSFADGMYKAVEEKLERSRLIEFAEHARSLRIRSVDDNGYNLFVQELKEKFPAELSLSSYSPRLFVDDDSVSVYYGNALTEHWGYSIVENDECPRKYLPRNNCLKVYDNVWVWDDIY